MRHLALLMGLLLPLSVLPGAGVAQESAAEDAGPSVPFKEGDVLTFDQLEKLKAYLPPAFWENRDYFFYEGMEIKVGPAFRDYSPPGVYKDATEKYHERVRITPDEGMYDYRGGKPFPEINCETDPQAGTKIAWNFVNRWAGDGAKANWSYTYWDRGDQLPLYYKGTSKLIRMSRRVEPQYDETDGDLFRNERRQWVQGIEVEEPFDARGILLLTYRYKAADFDEKETKNDDTWVYLPDLRRTRRISTAQRTDSVQGTDFTMDDLQTFFGIVPQYEWKCLGEVTLIAPSNTQTMAHPYSDDYNFGPYGFSFANDQWELRKAWLIQFDPKSDDHPYSRKDIYIDQNSGEPLYSFAYDRKEELWKIIWHNSRWSEDWQTGDPLADAGNWYPGWEGVENARDLVTVSDIIVNVQTGTGNRIEYWDTNGVPYSRRGKIRRYIDVGRLNKGR